MKKIGYSLIDDGSAEIAFAHKLPWNPSPPSKPKGRIATFTEVGQEAGGYRLVERWETERENPYQISAGSSIGFDGTKVVVDRQWTNPDLSTLKTKRIVEIKLAAGELILSRYPDYKQANMIARQGELHRIEAGLMRDDQGQVLPQRALTEGEIGELVVIANAWDWIKAVRVRSNELEAEVVALGTATDVAAWQATGWPE